MIPRIRLAKEQVECQRWLMACWNNSGAQRRETGDCVFCQYFRRGELRCGVAQTAGLDGAATNSIKIRAICLEDCSDFMETERLHAPGPLIREACLAPSVGGRLHVR